MVDVFVVELISVSDAAVELVGSGSASVVQVKEERFSDS